MASQRHIVAGAIADWRAAGRDVVLASVVSSSDSAPRGLGAQLAVTANDVWVGGLSGGCAEVAVLDAARSLLALGDAGAQRALLLSLTKDALGAVGPICGATLGVLVERVGDDLAVAIDSALRLHDAGHWVHVRRHYELLSGMADAPEATGVIGDDTRAQLDRIVAIARGVDLDALAADEVATGSNQVGNVSWRTRSRTDSGADHDPYATGRATFDNVIPPKPRVIVCGAGDVAAEVLVLARSIGWRTVLVDPRPRFVEHTTSLVEPDLVMAAWPGAAIASLDIDHSTACLSLAHDEKLDTPFLAGALQTDAFWVGSVGSRVVQRARTDLLRELVGDAAAARHRGPAGLDLGGADAAEIALSIVAELVAVWNGRTAAPISTTQTPIRAR